VTGRDGVLAIGGSAGSVEALVELVARLPADLPAAVLVTVHVGGNARSSLPRILARSGPLPAVHARHGEPLRTGRIYVAPPDFHLLAAAGVARLSSGARVNHHRPAVDVMFASAARWGGRRLVAVVLSGVLDDGAVGAALVARAGGRVVVQDPADALFDSMPRAALSAVRDAVAAPASGLVEAIEKAFDDLLDGHDGGAGDGGAGDGGAGDGMGVESEVVEMRMGDSDDPGFLSADEARLTRLSCPECSGGLAEVDLTGIRYYRCHVGHQYSPRSLEAAQREATEAKLWAAVAALEEHAALARHLSAGRGLGGGDDDEGYRRVADRSARVARSLLSGLQDRQAAPMLDGGQGRRAGPHS
jgi:two-component system chemotaxis response regulator CheB